MKNLRTFEGNAKTPTCAIVILLLISVFVALFPATVIAVEEPPRDQTLIISSDWNEPAGYNPLMSKPAYFTSLMYPSLYLYSPYSDEWIPYLAKSYKWLDKTTLQVTLRNEAKWWNGTPITAEDVKYSLELGKTYNVSMYTPLWTYLERVSVSPTNNKVVLFYLNIATLNYFKALKVLWQPLILPKARWEGLEAQYGAALTTEFKDDIFDNIVGAGPYRVFADDRPSALIYAQRVDDWWGASIYGLPNSKYLISRGLIGSVTPATVMGSGEVDVGTFMIAEIWTLFSTGVRTYYPNPPYFVSQGPVFLNINYLKKPLDNPTVRRAIAHALPLDAMVSWDQSYTNYSVPSIPVPIIHTGPAAKYINQTLIDQYGWTYNLAAAEALLDNANMTDVDGDGFREMPDGTELSGYTIQVPANWADWMAYCELIAANLNQIGIGVTPEYPDFQPTWWSRVANGEMDLYLGWSGWAPGFDHPWNAFSFGMDNRQSFPSGNWMNYPDSGSDLIGSAAAKPLIDAIQREVNATKIASMYSQLQEIWLKDVVAIPLLYGAVWYEYQTTTWVGFPSEDYPWFCNLYGGTPGTSGWPSQLPMLFTLKPAGQTPTTPAWVTALKFSTDKIFADLAAAPKRSTDLNDDAGKSLALGILMGIAIGAISAILLITTRRHRKARAKAKKGSVKSAVKASSCEAMQTNEIGWDKLP